MADIADTEPDEVARFMLFRLGRALAGHRLGEDDSLFSRFLALMMDAASLQYVKLTSDGHGTYCLSLYTGWLSGSYEEVRNAALELERELEVLGFTKKTQVEEGMDEFEFAMEVPHQYTRVLEQSASFLPQDGDPDFPGLFKSTDLEAITSDDGNGTAEGSKSAGLSLSAPGNGQVRKDAHAGSQDGQQDDRGHLVGRQVHGQQSQQQRPPSRGALGQEHLQKDLGRHPQAGQSQDHQQASPQLPLEHSRQQERSGHEHKEGRDNQQQGHSEQQRQGQAQPQRQQQGGDAGSHRHREEELLQDGPLFMPMTPIQRLVPITLQSEFVGFDEQGPIRGWGVEQVAHWLAVQPYFRDYGDEVRDKFVKEQINGLALLSLDDHQLSQMGFTVGLRNNLRHLIDQARSREGASRGHAPTSPPRSGLIPPFPMTMSSLNTVPPPVSSPPSQASVGSALALMVDGSGDGGSYLGKRAAAIHQEKKMHAYVDIDAEAINQHSAFAILEPIMPPEGMRLAVTRKTSRKGGIAREKLTGILGQVVLLQRKSGDILDDISMVEGDLLVPGCHSLGSVKFRKWEVVNHCIRVVLRHVNVPCQEQHDTVLQTGDGPPKKKRARRETQSACMIFTITASSGKHTVVLPLLMHHNNTTSVGPSVLHVQPGCVTINSATKEVSPPKVLIRGFHLNNSVISWTAEPANPSLPTLTLPILDVIQIKKTGVSGRDSSRLVDEAVEFDMPWEEQLPVGVSKDCLMVDGKPHMDHLTWTLVIDATPLASVAATQLSATYRLLPKPDETEVKWGTHSCWNRHLDVMFQ